MRLGVSTKPDVSRRECLTQAAAAALGYTLAAGPVRAAAIKTGTEGLSAGMATVKVPGGEMPLYFARPGAARETADHPRRHGSVRPA